MTVERLQRVLWRLRRHDPDEHGRYTNFALRRAIMLECGTDPKTIRNNRKALIELRWIKVDTTAYIQLTDEDLTSC